MCVHAHSWSPEGLSWTGSMHCVHSQGCGWLTKPGVLYSGNALQEPTAAPSEVVALLPREPAGAVGHWGARPMAAGGTNLFLSLHTPAQRLVMMPLRHTLLSVAPAVHRAGVR